MKVEGLHEATLRGLDWPVLVEAWARCARTPMGGQAVRALAPLADRQEIEQALDRCAEVLVLDRLGASLPVGGVADVRQAAGRAAKGVVLDPSDLALAGSSMRAMLHLRRALDEAAADAPSL